MNFILLALTFIKFRSSIREIAISMPPHVGLPPLASLATKKIQNIEYGKVFILYSSLNHLERKIIFKSEKILSLY